MALSFPNASRNYDARRQCVQFKGYDKVFEVDFELPEGALAWLVNDLPEGQASLLSAFDANRQRIERAAAKAYGRQKRNKTYALSVADF